LALQGLQEAAPTAAKRLLVPAGHGKQAGVSPR
jgi:hypothetical protein